MKNPLAKEDVQRHTEKIHPGDLNARLQVKAAEQARTRAYIMKVIKSTPLCKLDVECLNTYVKRMTHGDVLKHLTREERELMRNAMVASIAKMRELSMDYKARQRFLRMRKAQQEAQEELQRKVEQPVLQRREIEM